MCQGKVELHIVLDQINVLVLYYNQVNTFENYQNRLPTQWYLFLIVNKYIYTNMIVLIGDNILKMFSYLKTVVTFLVKFL